MLTAMPQAGDPGQTLDYTMRVTNNDSVGCYSSDFSVEPFDVTLDWMVDYPTQAVTVLPQEYADFTVHVTSSIYAYDGLYDINMVGINRYNDPVAGGESYFFQPLYYKVINSPYEDTVAPGVQIFSPTQGANIKKGSTVLINVQAVDNFGVTNITFYANGTELCNGTSPQCFWTPTVKGSYTLKITARDAAGNVGQNSVTVNVR
jgi:hypothetical protein